jgi:hypothetical protein
MADTQIETNGTANLIASDKVEGTEIYNSNEERPGSIRNLMIGKRSGQVEYVGVPFRRQLTGRRRLSAAQDASGPLRGHQPSFLRHQGDGAAFPVGSDAHHPAWPCRLSAAGHVKLKRIVGEKANARSKAAVDARDIAAIAARPCRTPPASGSTG